MSKRLKIVLILIFGICIYAPARTSLATAPLRDDAFRHSESSIKSGLFLNFNELAEYRAEGGFRNLEPHSIALTDIGLKAYNEKKGKEAIILFEKAKELSPDFPLPYLYLTNANFSFSQRGLTSASSYFLDAWAAFFNNFWWSFQTIGFLSISLLLAFYISIIVLLITLMSSRLQLYIHDIKEDKRKFFLMLPSIILVVFGPIFGIIGLALPFRVYIKGKEKIVVYSTIVIAAVLVFMMPLFSSFLGALQDETFRNVVNINKGIYTGETPETLINRRGYEDTFSYALALKKRGYYNEAIKIYQELLDQKNSAKVYNNLANSYIGLGNYDMALTYYDKALQFKKMTSIYYNLSQIYRENFDFSNAKKYYQDAIKIDFERVAFFNSVRGTSVNRFVMDEPLSNKELWLLAFKWAPYYRSSVFLEKILSFTNREFSLVLLLLLITAFYVYGRYVSTGAYACKRCGKIYCSNCERKISQQDVCHVCFKSLVKTSELSSKERLERVLEIHHYKDRKNKRLKILTLIFPGSGHVYYGWPVRGFLIMISFTLFLFLTLLLIYVPTPISMNQVASFFRWISAVGFIMVYLFTAINVFRRIL